MPLNLDNFTIWPGTYPCRRAAIHQCGKLAKSTYEMVALSQRDDTRMDMGEPTTPQSVSHGRRERYFHSHLTWETVYVIIYTQFRGFCTKHSLRVSKCHLCLHRHKWLFLCLKMHITLKVAAENLWKYNQVMATVKVYYAISHEKLKNDVLCQKGE